jgi:hypothetical protein
MTGVEIPAPLKNILGKPILHASIIDKQEMCESVRAFVK